MCTRNLGRIPPLFRSAQGCNKSVLCTVQSINLLNLYTALELLVIERNGTVELEAGWSYHALLVGGGGGRVSQCTVHRYCTALYTLCCRV